MTKLEKLEELLERVRTRGVSPVARVADVHDALLAYSDALEAVTVGRVALGASFADWDSDDPYPLDKARERVIAARVVAIEVKKTLLEALGALTGALETFPTLANGPSAERMKKDVEKLRELTDLEVLEATGYRSLAKGYEELKKEVETQLALDRFKEQLS